MENQETSTSISVSEYGHTTSEILGDIQEDTDADTPRPNLAAKPSNVTLVDVRDSLDKCDVA